MQAFGFTVRGDGSEALELDVYDVVGDDCYYDSVTAKSVRRLLKSNPSAKTIKLRINSGGGDVFDGFAIYNLLSEHPARVECDIDALAGSVASVIAMAADEIRIASNAWVMIHNPWGCTAGESEDLRRWADVLDKMRGQAADIYAARTGQTVAKALELMAAETWMTAAEAKALGFVDKIMPMKKAQAAKASARAFACMSIEDYDTAPAGVRELVASARAERAQQTLDLAKAKSTPQPGGADMNPATGEETSQMEDTLKAFLAAHGFATVADLTAQLAVGAKASMATGKSGDEAHGVMLAWKKSHEALPALQARVTELEAAASAGDLEKVIADAKAAKKLTPASETMLRAQMAAGEISLVGARAMLEAMPAIPALANPNNGPAVITDNDGKHGGKLFADMTGAERAALRKEDPAKYQSMLAAHKALS